MKKKISEQCFSSKIKPTCQNSANFEHFEKHFRAMFLSKMKPTCQNSANLEHFEKWPKNGGGVLACSLSIIFPVPD